MKFPRASALLAAAAFAWLPLGRLFAAAPDAVAPPTAFQVTGDVAKKDTWTVGRLEADFGPQIKTVSYTLKGEKHTARAVPLYAVLKSEEPRINPHIKHHELQFVVAAVGHDGYTVYFSMAELSPEIGGRAVWVALDKDGKPLPSSDGPPLDLLVPDDVKPARWVHSVTQVVVTDVATALPGGSASAH